MFRRLCYNNPVWNIKIYQVGFLKTKCNIHLKEVKEDVGKKNYTWEKNKLVLIWNIQNVIPQRQTEEDTIPLQTTKMK